MSPWTCWGAWNKRDYDLSAHVWSMVLVSKSYKNSYGIRFEHWESKLMVIWFEVGTIFQSTFQI